MLIDFVEKEETFFDNKNKKFLKSQKWHFSKGVNPCYRSKNANFSLLVFGQNKFGNKV